MIKKIEYLVERKTREECHMEIVEHKFEAGGRDDRKQSVHGPQMPRHRIHSREFKRKARLTALSLFLLQINCYVLL